MNTKEFHAVLRSSSFYIYTFSSDDILNCSVHFRCINIIPNRYVTLSSLILLIYLGFGVSTFLQKRIRQAYCVFQHFCRESLDERIKMTVHGYLLLLLKKKKKNTFNSFEFSITMPNSV